MRDQAHFWNKIAQRYAAKPIADADAYQRKLEQTRGYLRSDMSVLEIGCGTGSTAIHHAPYVSDIHVVDISPAMLTIARERAAASQIANMSFACSSVEVLNFPDAVYDAVFAHSILHLLADMEGAIGKVFRWLKPGGIFVSNTACIADLNLAIRSLLPLGQTLGIVPPLNVFHRDHLEAAIDEAGFGFECIWPLKHGAFIIARKSDAIRDLSSREAA